MRLKTNIPLIVGLFTIICMCPLIKCGKKYTTANTIVIQNGGGGGGDEDDEGEMIIQYTTLPIPIQMRRSIINPSYLYPIHRAPSMPSYRMTQRSIVHIPSPPPIPYSSTFQSIERFPTIPAYDGYGTRIAPSSIPPPPSPPPQVHHIPPPEPFRPLIPQTSPPPLPLPQMGPQMGPQMIPLSAQTQGPPDSRDSRYYSLHEPWPPAYSVPKSAEVVTGQNEAQNEVNSGEYNGDRPRINGGSAQDGNEYSDDEQDYKQDYKTDYKSDYKNEYQQEYDQQDYRQGSDQQKPESDYYPEYQDSREYQDYRDDRPAIDGQQDYIHDSGEYDSYQNPQPDQTQNYDGYQEEQKPRYGNQNGNGNEDDTYKADGSGERQSNYQADNQPKPQTPSDYQQDYYDYYNSPGQNNMQNRDEPTSIEPRPLNQPSPSSEPVDDRQPPDPNPNYPDLTYGNQGNGLSDTVGQYGSLTGYSGTEPGVRADPQAIPVTDFDLTGDPYLDNFGKPPPPVPSNDLDYSQNNFRSSAESDRGNDLAAKPSNAHYDYPSWQNQDYNAIQSADQPVQSDQSLGQRQDLNPDPFNQPRGYNGEEWSQY